LTRLLKLEKPGYIHVLKGMDGRSAMRQSKRFCFWPMAVERAGIALTPAAA
jgi:hypothetical protein